MSIQTLIRGVGGTIETYFLDRQVVSATVNVSTGQGTKKVTAAACTIDSVSTTVSTITLANDEQITVADATGVVVGRRYLIGAPSSADPREVVSVKDILGNVLTLWGPLNYAHATGSTFTGIRVSYAVPAAACDQLWWDGYADFTPDTGDVNTETVDCTLRKIPDNIIDETDLMMVFPKGAQMLDAELDMPRALREARDEFLLKFGGKNRAHTAMGVDVFRRPIALMFWVLRRHALGPGEWKDMMDSIEAELESRITKMIEQIPFDVNQDGSTVGLDDGGTTMIELRRA